MQDGKVIRKTFKQEQPKTEDTKTRAMQKAQAWIDGIASEPDAGQEGEGEAVGQEQDDE